MPKKYVRLADRDKANGNYSPIFFFNDCLPSEEWRPVTDRSIPDVSPVYYISNYGRVCSTYYYKPIFVKPSSDGKGYLKYNFWTKNKKVICRRAHRCEMMEFCYFPGCEKYEINHIDGNKQNNWIGNLEWCTHEQNMHHALVTGLEDHLHRTGEQHHNSKITDAQADEIGRLLATQEYSRDEIAKMVGCSESIVHNISGGQCRKCIYDKYDLGNRKKCRSDAIFGSDEVEQICQYFQDNYKKYDDLKKLFRNVIRDLFPERMGKDYVKTRAAVREIYQRKHYPEIASKYTWGPYYK